MLKELDLLRVPFVLMLAFGFMAASVSITTAHDTAGADDHARFTGSDMPADNGDLVEQLVQVLIEILNELLNGDDDLADALPEGCEVTQGGFRCDTSSGPTTVFLGDHCEPSIFDDGVYLCSVATLVYSCTLHKIVTPSSPTPTTQLICAAS